MKRPCRGGVDRHIIASHVRGQELAGVARCFKGGWWRTGAWRSLIRLGFCPRSSSARQHIDIWVLLEHTKCLFPRKRIRLSSLGSEGNQKTRRAAERLRLRRLNALLILQRATN